MNRNSPDESTGVASSRLARLSSKLRRARKLGLGATALAVAGAVAFGHGCTDNSQITTQVDFYGPSGLAVAPSRDRDLLFIASTGGDDLRAITICNTPSPTDGGAALTTCTDTEDFHFLPGPIRLFAGSFPVGNRPVRLASINLRDADGGVVGGVLVAGVAALVTPDGGISDSADGGVPTALPALKLVDSVNLLDATQHTATIKVPSSIALDTPPIDVVSQQLLTGATPLPNATQQAFVLTEANVASGVPAEVSTITLSPTSNGPAATVVGRCSLAFSASRLALIPGQSDLLYVSDATTVGAVAGGLGDGAVEISTQNIPPISSTVPPCIINRRLVATDPATGQPRGLTSLALSPAYFAADGRAYPPGALMLGVSTDGLLVFIRTDLGVAPPIPPFTPVPYDGGTVVGISDGRTAVVLPDGGVAPLLADGGFDVPLPGVAAQPMEPLRVNALAREVAFFQTPLTCPANTPPSQPCEIINVGASQDSFAAAQFALVAAVTSSDGTVVFVDADDRRFVSDTRDATAGSTGFQALVNTSYTFSPAQPGGQENPSISFASADTSSPECNATVVPVTCKPVGWSQAGVARQTPWRAVWHAQVQGLERQGGTLTQEDATHLRFTMPGVDTSRWTNPTLNDPLTVGDPVAFEAFSTASGAAVCDVLAAENALPLAREYTITTIGPDYFILDTSMTNVSGMIGPLNIPAECLPVGGVAEVRYGAGDGNRPWLIIQGNLIHGRAATGVQFTATETRFDYPLQYELYPDNPGLLPTIANDIGVAFTISPNGEPDPVTAQSTFTWTISSGQSPTRVSDTSSLGGFAGPVITYTSTKIPGNLVFFSSTGSNSVIQIDPSLIGVLNGVISYR